MATIHKPSDPFLAAAAAVDRQLARCGRVVAVHPLVAELARELPRHRAQELSAAVITAIALRGAVMCWDAVSAVSTAG